MSELIENFLRYIYRTHSGSEKTVEAYRRDLEQLKNYLVYHIIKKYQML